jgi:hypothetical protein
MVNDEKKYKKSMKMIGNDFLRKFFFSSKDAEENSPQFF